MIRGVVLASGFRGRELLMSVAHGKEGTSPVTYYTAQVELPPCIQMEYGHFQHELTWERSWYDAAILPRRRSAARVRWFRSQEVFGLCRHPAVSALPPLHVCPPEWITLGVVAGAGAGSGIRGTGSFGASQSG